MGRKPDSGQFFGIEPDAPTWKPATVALFGNLAGTKAEYVCDWIRLNNERLQLLDLEEKHRGIFSPATRKAKVWLETWFFKAIEDRHGDLDWSSGGRPEDFAALTKNREELDFRGKIARLHQRSKNLHSHFFDSTRDALLSLNADYFRNIAEMITRIKDHSETNTKPANRAEHLKHAICMIVADERSRADALNGVASNGLNEPMPGVLQIRK